MTRLHRIAPALAGLVLAWPALAQDLPKELVGPTTALAEAHLDVLRQRSPVDYQRLLARLGGRRPTDFAVNEREGAFEAIRYSRLELADSGAMTAPDGPVRDALWAQVGISQLHSDDPKLCYGILVLGPLAAPPAVVRRDLPLAIEAQERLLAALIEGREHPIAPLDWKPVGHDALRDEFKRTVEEFGSQPGSAVSAELILKRRNHPDLCRAFVSFFDYIITTDTPQASLMRRLEFATLAVRGSVLAFLLR